jgi:hypothetical protein
VPTAKTTNGRTRGAATDTVLAATAALVGRMLDLSRARADEAKAWLPHLTDTWVRLPTSEIAAPAIRDESADAGEEGSESWVSLPEVRATRVVASDVLRAEARVEWVDVVDAMQDLELHDIDASLASASRRSDAVIDAPELHDLPDPPADPEAPTIELGPLPDPTASHEPVHIAPAPSEPVHIAPGAVAGRP